MKKSPYLLLILLFISLQTFAANNLVFKIEGLEAAEQKNALARLNVVRNTFPKDITDKQINDVYKMGLDEVQKALQPFGYYKSKINSNLSHDDETWTALYRVDKGRPVIIAGVDISVEGEGAENTKILKVLSRSSLKKDDVLLTTKYENEKDRLFNVCNNQGYIKARFVKTDILIDLKKYTAYITIHLETGRRFYFGKTTFGPSLYTGSFLSRFISDDNQEGKPFSNKALLNLQQEMSGSSYFKQVDVVPEYNKSQDDQIPIKINTSVPRSQRYDIGLGYGTFTGPRMSAGIKLRRLTDTGHHFDANIRLSSVLSGITAKYFIPGRNPITDRWILGADYKKFKPKNGDSESQTYFFGLIKRLGRLKTSTTLNYLLERYTILNKPNKNRNFLYPNLTIDYVKTNNLVNPKNGYSLNLSLQGASERILSATNFFQADAKAKYITTPLSFAKIIARGEIGYTLVNDLQNLPLTLRFLTGGLTSIRGFPDSSIGPGKYLQVGSLEYQNKIYKDFWGAVFYDIGSASNHVGHPINKGVGLGAVYYSIVGPVKLYVARAISKKDQPYGVEFSVGPEF